MQSTLRYRIAHSDHPAVQALKTMRRGVVNFSVPAPRAVFVPVLWGVLALRGAIHFVRRKFFAEPLFKAYCSAYGRNVHTGIFLHWVIGRGRIELGDDVVIEGKCSFIFAARYSATPTLKIGNRSGMGHNCTFTIGKSITIGDDVRMSGNINMFDSSGHPSEPEGRRRGDPAPDDSVKPIVIEDNVWIGHNVIIYPGVTIGRNAVVASGSVVMSSVAPNTLVAGNPARRMMPV